MTINRGRRVPLGSEEEEDDEDEPMVGAGSIDPAELATAAAKAAWDAARYAKRDDRVRAARWAEVSRAFAGAVDAVMQTRDQYALKEDCPGCPSTIGWISKDQPINPHQRIGVLSEDEIRTVMALRKGTAKVMATKERFVVDDSPEVMLNPDMEGETFEDWTRRQLDKLAVQIRELNNSVDDDDERNPHFDRYIWCMMQVFNSHVNKTANVVDSREISISPALWAESAGAAVSIKVDAFGHRIVNARLTDPT